MAADWTPPAPERQVVAAFKSPPPLQAGEVIDGFVLEEKSHMGGMAHLWRVHREQGPHEGALIMKVPRLKGGDDPATIVGFEVEQMILPLLSGPHVPRFVARGDDPARPYIVMERIEGASLKARFDEAPLPVDEVVQIGIRVAQALQDLHLQNVIHLDIKPSNILFRPGGEAVLVDFGLSRHAQLPDLLDEEFELPLGTGPYMSPEQVQFVRTEPRSDLFALGVMLYHLLTGERPFGAPQTVRGLRKRLWQDPVPPRALRADCPPWLQEVILKCLSVSAEDRHHSAADLALDLQNPEQIELSPLASLEGRPSRWAALKRWAKAVGSDPRGPQSADLSTQSPILMVALDIAQAEAQLLERLRETVTGLLHMRPGARLACVAVMKTHRVGMDELTDADGRSKHMRMLVQLKHWARPIAVDGRGHRVTYHVLESPDVPSAIVDHAHKARVDHLVLGARSSGMLRRYLGSVSAQVAAQARMTVTVVRLPPAGEARLGAESVAEDFDDPEELSL